MTDAAPLLDTLANFRTLRDSEVATLLAESERGDPEGIEWAMARIGDLTAAAALLREHVLAGLDAGGWATMLDVATREGVSYDAVRQRIERGSGGLEYVEGPARGRGPRVQAYIRTRPR